MSDICELCFLDNEYLGSSGGLVVGRLFGQVALLIEPCHRGDDLLIFDEDPIPDPVTPELEARVENLPDDEWQQEDVDTFEASFAWTETAFEKMKELVISLGSINSVWDLGNDLRAAGYAGRAVDGAAELWLYNRIGQIIKESADNATE